MDYKHAKIGGVIIRRKKFSSQGILFLRRYNCFNIFLFILWSINLPRMGDPKVLKEKTMFLSRGENWLRDMNVRSSMRAKSTAS